MDDEKEILRHKARAAAFAAIARRLDSEEWREKALAENKAAEEGQKRKSKLRCR